MIADEAIRLQLSMVTSVAALEFVLPIRANRVLPYIVAFLNEHSVPRTRRSKSA